MKNRIENLLWILVVVSIFAIAATDPIVWDWVVAKWLGMME